jgi:uncharacterized Tic20 family protein
MDTPNVPPVPPSTPPPPPPFPSGMSESDERLWAMLTHLSSIVTAFFGGFALLGPLIIWLIFKDKSAYVDYHGKEALNFQILMTVVFVAGLFGGIITCGIGFILFPIVYVVNVVLVIIAGIAANRGEMYQYPFNWRLVK